MKGKTPDVQYVGSTCLRLEPFFNSHTYILKHLKLFRHLLKYASFSLFVLSSLWLCLASSLIVNRKCKDQSQVILKDKVIMYQLTQTVYLITIV